MSSHSARFNLNHLYTDAAEHIILYAPLAYSVSHMQELIQAHITSVTIFGRHISKEKQEYWVLTNIPFRI